MSYYVLQVHKLDVKGKRVLLNIWVRVDCFRNGLCEVVCAQTYDGRTLLVTNAYVPSLRHTIAAHKASLSVRKLSPRDPSKWTNNPK
jgi:hypothetical protein